MKYQLLILVLFFPVLVHSQDHVVVRGTVDTYNGAELVNLFVVNDRLKQGNFGNPNGTFEIKVKRTDRIIIGSTGFKNASISVADSALKDTLVVNITLQPLSYNLKTVTVFGERELKEIYHDIESLGYNKRDFQLTGVDAVSSPITALYAAFSRRERKIREAHRLMNEARRRDLLRELFQKYVDYNIINLDDQEFDQFIDFCNVSDQQLKGLSQYDFIMYVKSRYQLYRSLNPNDYYWDNGID